MKSDAARAIDIQPETAGKPSNFRFKGRRLGADRCEEGDEGIEAGRGWLLGN